MTDSFVPPLVTYTPTTPEPGSVESYRAGFRKQWADEAEAWGSTMRVAIKTNPETAALADTLSKKMGMPLLKAQEDMGFLRAVSVMQRMKDDDIRSTNPVLYRSFQGLEFARKAWDDFEGLSAFERWGKGWKAGGLMAERGRLAAKLWLSGGLEWDEKAGRYKQSDTDRMQRREDLARLEQVQVEQAELGPITGAWGNAGKIVGQYGPAIPRALWTGVKTGAAAGGLTLLGNPPAAPAAALGGFWLGTSAQFTADTFTTMAGNLYADLIAAKYEPGRALAASVGFGLVGTWLELSGVNIATNAVRQKIMGAVARRAATEVAKDVPSGFLKGYFNEYGDILVQKLGSSAIVRGGVEYGKVMAGELVTEEAQEVAQILAEYLARRGGEKEMSPDGIASRLWEVGSSTVQGMALLGIPGAIAGGIKSRVGAYRQQEQKRAEEARDYYKRSQGIESMYADRDPEGAADFARQVLRQGDGPTEAHVDAATFRTLLDKIDAEGAASGQLRKSTLDSLEEIVPGIKQQFADAEAVSGDVSIPTADLWARIRKTLPEFEAAFSDVMRLDPQAPDAEAKADSSQVAPEMATDTDKKFYDELKQVEKDAAAKIQEVAGTKVDSAQARATAHVYSRMVESIAREEGKMPAAVAKDYGATFEAMLTDNPEALSQPGSSDYLTVYHGTAYGNFADRAKKRNALLRSAMSEIAELDAKESSLREQARTLDEEAKAKADDARKAAESDPAKMRDRRLVDEAWNIAYHWERKPALALLEEARGIRKKRDAISDRFLGLMEEIPEVDEFSLARAGSATDQGWAGTGIYFALDREEAESYSKVAGPGRMYADEKPSPYVYTAKLKRSDIYVKKTAGQEVVAKVEARAKELRDQGIDYKEADVQAIREAGFKARAFQDQIGGGKEISVFDPDAIEIVREVDQVLNQPKRGGFLQRALSIFLGPDSDVSTVLHEMVHWFVEVVERLDRQGSKYGKEQMDRLLAHWKLDRDQWAALTPEQRVPYLEDIAYNAEDYFASGEAPSAELRGVFTKLRSFLVGIYGAVRKFLTGAYSEELGGAQLRAISPELRSFFDRMLASDAAIEIETASRAGAARLSDAAAKAMGIEGEQLAEIRAKEAEAIEEAKAALTAEAVRGGRFFAAGRRNAEAAVKAKLDEARAKIRAQVEQDVASRPVYRAQTFIREGEIEQDDGTMKSAKLDTDAVRAILGDDAAQLKGYTRKGGANPDLMARQFGFASGEAMLRAILNAPSQDELIEAETAQRLEADEPLANPKEFKRAVEEALHGKTAGRLAATILRAMLRGIKSTAELEAGAREAARVAIARTPIGKISVRGFAQAELRAAKARDKAIASGDVAAAIEAQRRLLVQHYLTLEAAKAEREIERETATIAKRFEQPDDKLKQGRNLDVVKVAIAMLGKWGMISAPRYNAAVEQLAQWEQLDPVGYEPYRVRLAILVDKAVPMEQMTLDSFRVVAGAADGFWSEAKRSNQVLVNGVLVDRQLAQAQILDQIVDTFGREDGKLPDFRPEEMHDWSMGAILANMSRLEAWTRKMDGGKPGMVHRYVYLPLKDALVAKELEAIAQHAWARDHMAKHAAIKPLSGQEMDLQPILGQGKDFVFKSRAHLVGTLYLLGTEKGRTNFIVGNGIGPMTPGTTYDEAYAVGWEKWQRAMKYAVDKGWLFEEDFKLAQEVVDHIASTLKERLFRTAFEQWGERPHEEKASPWQTPFGTLPGGYFPSKVDKTKSRVGTNQQLSALMHGAEEYRKAHASVPRGTLIKRGEQVVQPRITDMRLLTQHIDEVLNIIHLQPAIRDVAGLLNGNTRNNEQLGALREALDQVAPFAERKIILPALDRMARDSIVAPGDKGMAKGVAYLRQAASMAFLGFNPKNAALQFTGLVNAVPEVGFKNLMGAFWTHWHSPQQLVESIRAKRPAMQARWSSELQLLAQDMERMLEPSRLNDARKAAAQAAFFMQRMAQMFVDAMVWQAANDKATAEGLSTEVAGERADSAVRLTQGEKSPLDVPNFLSGNAIAQLFTQFADYPNTVLNQNLAAPEGRRFAVFAWTVIAPALATSAIGLTLAFGKVGKGERDDESYAKQLLEHFLGDQVRGAFGLLPIGGPLVGSALNELFGLSNTPGGMRNSPFAAWSIVETLSRIGSGQGSYADWITGLNIAAQLPGRPVANLVRFEQNVAAGGTTYDGPLDYLRVLLTGKD